MGWGTVLKAGRSQARFSIGSIDPSSHTIALGGNSGWWLGLRTLPPACADCLDILGAPTFWSPEGLSRPVQIDYDDDDDDKNNLLLIKCYNLFKALACPTTFFHLSLFCATFFQLHTFMLFISSKTSFQLVS